jgi:phosphoribosylaminoimidazolecarboxamide formyltransferase / IMP cyclohydrolase
MKTPQRIRRALISVSDKTGAVEFARVLDSLGVEIISTGGTASELRGARLTVTDVSDVTGFPEMMGGRVKTLHPKIHGGLLALRDDPEHQAAMREQAIEPIDMVVINLYPFESTIARHETSLEEAVENIDIGGPAMIRSAAKNWRDVAVVTDPRQYDDISRELKANDGSLRMETRQKLAATAFTRTAAYDAAISAYLDQQLEGEGLPEAIGLHLKRSASLRYGENPHQRAGLYTEGPSNGLAAAEQLQGKEMSFNNYVDAQAAWDLVNEFDETAVAIIKHTNPSGVGTGQTAETAYRRALATDPVSAFGGIVAFNRKVDAASATAAGEIFTEVVIAPDYDADALTAFAAKKNLRLLKMPAASAGPRLEFKQISGGFLVQDGDALRIGPEQLRTVTKKQPTDNELQDLLFAWRVCKHVRSNAIVIARNGQTIGVGAGQMNRVDSLRIAAARAERFGLEMRGSVLASDAFFPFRDNVDEAGRFGISAIIQPGGSVKDEETIAAADEHGISMVFTDVRHFKH